jgi:hypothetical protein
VIQDIADESRGLDNVKVEVSGVPFPLSMWLLGSGLVGLARLRVNFKS